MTAITIDSVFHALSILLLNPVFPVLLPISMVVSTSMTISSWPFRIALAYCLFVYSVRGLDHIFRKIRTDSGTNERRKWTQDIVLITGGSAGLGYALAAGIAMKRCKVIVLDVVTPVDPIPGSIFIQCDVASEPALIDVSQQILHNHGVPTIVISNAGVMRASTILQSTMAEVDLMLNVNLRAQFLLARAFLPAMLNTGARPGQWVTIASSLGYVGVHSLAAYTATKAGTIAFHESLTAELGGTNVTTTMILPGQLNSAMFSGVANPNNFLAPVLDVTQLAREILQKIEGREAGEFGFPLYANYLGLLRVLPSGVSTLVRRMAGMDKAMTDMTASAKRSATSTS